MSLRRSVTPRYYSKSSAREKGFIGLAAAGNPGGSRERSLADAAVPGGAGIDYVWKESALFA